MHPTSTIDNESGSAFARVVEIMHRLRGPGGCPWDRAQTFDSIRTHTLEETYEVLEAIGDRNWEGLREELGDLLLQVLFYAEMAAEENRFTLTEVLSELGEKLVRRHPHVFGDEAGSAKSPHEALGRWNAVKAAEKGTKPKSILGEVPREMPALAEADKIGRRVAAAGFDWENAEGVFLKLHEEIDELRHELERGDTPRSEEELGDLLLTVTSLGRHLQLDAEAALKHANRKFRQRFQAMEAAAAGRDLAALTPQEWDQLWQATKQ